MSVIDPARSLARAENIIISVIDIGIVTILRLLKRLRLRRDLRLQDHDSSMKLEIVDSKLPRHMSSDWQ